MKQHTNIDIISPMSKRSNFKVNFKKGKKFELESTK